MNKDSRVLTVIWGRAGGAEQRVADAAAALDHVAPPPYRSQVLPRGQPRLAAGAARAAAGER